jgi:hypothetical protein
MVAYQTKRMTYKPAFSITGTHIMEEDGKFFISQIENDCFRNAISSLYDFVTETNADCDMAYDWVCDQCDIQTFVADTYAWDMFFDVYTQATA